MRHHVYGIAMIVFCLIAGFLLFEIVTVDFLVYIGALHGDFPDPNRPGHLKGIMVSTPEILLKVLIVAVCVVLASRCYRCMRVQDASQKVV